MPYAEDVDSCEDCTEVDRRTLVILSARVPATVSLQPTYRVPKFTYHGLVAG